MSHPMQRLHLAREVKTALELAIAALAPAELIDRLAIAAGLLEAFDGLALDGTSTLPIVLTTTERAQRALADWQRWQRDHLPKATA